MKTRGQAVFLDMAVQPLYRLTVPEHKAHLALDAALPHVLGHSLGELHGQGDGLLDQEMDAMATGELDLVGVSEGREADVDQIQAEGLELGW
jgi:hypothetical protein